jgi:divalent metal cation (Fe/Co/Zn/Cd) transporter
MVGYHKLRARIAPRHRYIDMHVQFRTGTTLERAHALAHKLRDEIESELGDAEVLIHVEPETSRHDPSESPEQYRAG